MKKILLLLISFAICINIFANTILSKELNAPRPGDKINLYHIKTFINLNDSLVIDLSATELEKNYKIAYSDFKDTLLICTQHRKAEVLSFLGDSIMLISHRKPGLTLDYIIPEISAKYPLVDGENINGIFFAEGTRAMRDYARISGKYTFSADTNNYTLITPEADTISDLIHTKYIRHGSTVIDSDFSRSYKSDSTVILPDSIMWHLENDSITHLIERHCLYVRGYRYPIMETRLHKVLYYGTPIDSSFVALYCSKSSQAHDLASDPANEELRLEEASTSFSNNFGDISNTKSRDSFSNDSFSLNNDNNIASSLSDDEYCHISHSGDANSILNIKFSATPDCIVAVTLHNSAGALMWHTNEVAEIFHGEISYPTHHLVAGEYLVTVFLKNSQYSFKFIKK